MLQQADAESIYHVMLCGKTATKGEVEREKTQFEPCCEVWSVNYYQS